MAYGTRIPIKTRAELDAMREAGRHVGEILLALRQHAKAGVRTRGFSRSGDDGDWPARFDFFVRGLWAWRAPPLSRCSVYLGE